MAILFRLTALQSRRTRIMAHVWLLCLVSRDFQQIRSWPLSAHLSESSAQAARPGVEAAAARIRADARAREALLKTWEAANPRPPEALEAAPGNPYRAKHRTPEAMTAHGRAADAAWLVARHQAMAEAGLTPREEIPQPLALAEFLLDARVEIFPLPLLP